MPFISGKHVHRRTVLRGIGATVALPFLDAMVPARGPWSRTASAASLDRTRLVCIEMVHGAAGSTEWGASSISGRPPRPGGISTSRPAPSARSSRSEVPDDRQRHRRAAGRSDHAAGNRWRTTSDRARCSHPVASEADRELGCARRDLAGSDLRQPVRPGHADSVDAALHRDVDQAGGCAYGYSCVYTDLISWASTTEPLPMIRDPRMAFDQLFGAGGSTKERASRRRATSSVLDYVTGQVADLSRRLDASDRRRMERYLDDVREIERRIQRIQAQHDGRRSRAAQRADGRAGLVRRAREADVRPAGARVPGRSPACSRSRWAAMPRAASSRRAVSRGFHPHRTTARSRTHHRVRQIIGIT